MKSPRRRPLRAWRGLTPETLEGGRYASPTVSNMAADTASTALLPLHIR